VSTTTAPTPGLTIPALARALPRVEAEIHRMATSSSPPIVNEFSGRITAAGGKRLRSVLALVLASTVALAGEVTDRAVTAARGPGPAVLVGDFMLARAGQVAPRDISPFAAERLAEAVADLVEGQVLEVLDLHDPHRTPEHALRSIALETGALFRVGCVLAAHCADADEATAARCWRATRTRCRRPCAGARWSRTPSATAATWPAGPPRRCPTCPPPSRRTSRAPCPPPT